MADPQESAVGHVADVPREKEAIKENGDLSAADSHPEIVGKENEDPTLSSYGTAAAENGDSAIPSEEVEEAGKDGERATAVSPPPTEEHVQSIQERFLSLVGLGWARSDPPAPSPEVPKSSQEEAPKSEEPEKELPTETISPADEVQNAETKEGDDTFEKGHSKEIPETVGQAAVDKIPESGDTPETNESAGVVEDERPETLGTAKTNAADREISQAVDTPKTDEVRDTAASKTVETSEPEAVTVPVGEEDTTRKAEDKVHEPAAVNVTEEGIPQTGKTTGTDEAEGAEVGNINQETQPEVKPSPDVQLAEEEHPKSEERDREVPALGIPDDGQIGELGKTEPAEDATKKVQSDEFRETFEPKEAEVAEEKVTKALETPRTFSEPGGADVGVQKIPKAQETTESIESDGAAVAREGIPETLDTTETTQPRAIDIAGQENAKTLASNESDVLEPLNAEDKTPKPSEADEPKAEQVLVDQEKESLVDDTDTAREAEGEEKSAADVREFTPNVRRETEEPEKGDEGTPREVLVPPPILGQEQPVVEAEEPYKQGHGEALGKEAGARLPADIAEQETANGDAAPGDVSQERDGAQTEAKEVPQVETDTETTPKEVSPEALKEVSGPESSENATTETPEFVKQGSVKDSSMEIPKSTMEEKRSPATQVSKGFEETPRSTEKEPKEVAPITTSEDKPGDPGKQIAAKEALGEKEISQEGESREAPVSAAADTPNQPTEEASTEAKPDEKPPGEDGSPLERQPSLSVRIPKPDKAESLENNGSNGLVTPRGTPLIQRVEQLEQQLAQLESRPSPTPDFASTGHSTPRSSIDRPFRHPTRYVLEEAGSKGTLLDRVAALEQKFVYMNLNSPAHSNGPSTPPVPTVFEDSGTEPDPKPVEAESQSREWTPSESEGDKASQHVTFEGTSKPAEDRVNPETKEKSPEDLPGQTQAPPSLRRNSMNEKKIKAKAAVGKFTGIFTGCFHPKKGRAT